MKYYTTTVFGNTVIYYEQDGVRTSFGEYPDNTDYANFKKEVLAGAELQDAEGVVMTQAEADAYIASLP
jgi:hypothetical protein